MIKRLGDEDGQAVDLLLDKTASAAQTTTMYATPGNNGFDRRVHNVEAILGLLSQMPAEEPPADLLARTLERVQAQQTYAPTAAMHPIVQSSGRPNAS